MQADYATTAVRTGSQDSGGRGISLLLIPLKDHPGVSRRRLKVAGQISAGTSFIEFDDVQVPSKNLIGRQGEGMKYIMNNFNHERMFISIGVTRQARVALSEAFKYCLKREAFGKVSESLGCTFAASQVKVQNTLLTGSTYSLSWTNPSSGTVLPSAPRCSSLRRHGWNHSRINYRKCPRLMLIRNSGV